VCTGFHCTGRDIRAAEVEPKGLVVDASDGNALRDRHVHIRAFRVVVGGIARHWQYTRAQAGHQAKTHDCFYFLCHVTPFLFSYDILSLV
jgi:hypothetical protein